MRQACIYHSGDLDGHCSGAIVRVGSLDPTMLMLPMEYGDPIPWEKLKGLDRVYVVDFTLEPQEESMRTLSECVGEVVWIDHHKSAIDEADRLGFNPLGLRRVGQAACELCWEYFYAGRVKVPYTVWLLGRYDVWDRAASADVDPFQLSMQAQLNTNPTTPGSEAFWMKVFAASPAFIAERIQEGHVIDNYRKGLYQMYHMNAHEVRFYGETWLALNTQKVGSQAFEAIYDPAVHYGCLAYFRGKYGWVVSLYSLDNRADFSLIAKKYGGGGHPSACGFTLATEEEMKALLAGYLDKSILDKSVYETVPG